MITLELKEDDVLTLLLLLKEKEERRLWGIIREQMWEVIEQHR